MTTRSRSRDTTGALDYEAELDRRFLQFQQARYPGRPSRRVWRAFIDNLRAGGFEWRADGEWTDDLAEECGAVAIDAFLQLEGKFSEAGLLHVSLQLLERCGHVGWLRRIVRLWRHSWTSSDEQRRRLDAIVAVEKRNGPIDLDAYVARVGKLNPDRAPAPWELPVW